MDIPLRRSRAGNLWSRRGLFAALLAAGVGVAIVLVLMLTRRAEPAAAAQPPAAPGEFHPSDQQWRTLSLATIRAAAFPEEEETEGQVAVDDDLTVAVLPPFSGEIEQIMVQAGDHVSRGQPLAAVRAAEVAQAQADLSSATAGLSSAKTQLHTAEANSARQQALLAAQGAAVRDVQQAESDLAAAKAAVATGEANVGAVRSRLQILGYYNPQIDAMERRTSAPGGAVALVRAPIAGVVIQRQIGLGQYVNSVANGATAPMFSISDLSRVWLVANVREEDASRIRTGEPVQVSLPALPGRTFAARISYVAPAIDPATRRLPVRATLDSAGGLLKPGMFADFNIASAPAETAPAVPTAAVIYEGDSARVWIAHSDHSLVLRQIRTGRTRDGLVEVRSGLSSGEQVVVAGALFIDRAARSD